MHNKLKYEENTMVPLRKVLETTPIQCPECGKVSDSIKSYSLPNFTFLFIVYRWGYEHHVVCADCMRKKILEIACRGLLKANILWPVFYAPRLAVNLTRTFVKGHSEDIIDNLQLNLEEEWK